MTVQGRLQRIDELSQGERDEMFALMETYYENVVRSAFDADLGEKQWVILLTEPQGGAIRGFSTQMLLDAVVEGLHTRALFSGDTIVDREHWTHNPLTRIWGQLALSLIDAQDGPPLYWFLLSKGYRTYRFLPVFFRDFHPRHDTETPGWPSRLIDAFGSLKYPTSYDPRAGIVRAGPSGCRLHPGVAEITHRQLQDPHVRFFSERNPGHVRGDELCCIAPLTRENFRSAAWRAIGTPSVATLDVTT